VFSAPATRQHWLAAVFCILVLLAACQHRKRPEAWTMSLTTTPQVPAVDRDTTFTLHIRKANGEPLANAAARLSLEMTFMDMGPNVVQLQAGDPGTYVGKGRFTMAGEWDCRAIVKSGNEEQQQIFHYKIG
jgi:hypothetical protein